VKTKNKKFDLAEASGFNDLRKGAKDAFAQFGLAKSAPPLPEELIWNFTKTFLLLLVPAGLGLIMGSALGSAAIIVAGIAISAAACGLGAYRLCAAKAKGVTLVTGVITGHVREKSLMSWASYLDDYTKPMLWGRAKSYQRSVRNTAKYTVELDGTGEAKDYTIATTNSPLPIGTRVKIYISKADDGLNNALMVVPLGAEEEG
jgi:hypothetical protein